jgi:hypothetical protein
VTIPVTPQPGRRAFLAIPGTALSGGIGGLDVICQTKANAAALGGTFVALAATGAASAASRFNTMAGTATWVRTDGVPITATAADLFAPAARWVSLIDLDETQHTLPGLNNAVVIGARSVTAQAQPGENCADFGGAGNVLVGRVGLPPPYAFDESGGGSGTPVACSSTQLSIYCLEQ